MKKRLGPEDIARLGLARLRAEANPETAEKAQSFFKERVKSYGLSSPMIRSIAGGLYQSIKGDWSPADAVNLCDILYRESELEAKALATLILTKFKADYPKSLFNRIKNWLAAGLLDNWASVDLLCPEVMGALILRYPDLADKTRSWAGHSSRWVKRAAAVSFIKLARKEEFADVIYAVATALFPVGDDLVEKANGWLLREAGKRDAGRLEKFLLEHGAAVPRTTLRYAIERFEEKKRRDLLLKTRA